MSKLRLPRTSSELLKWLAVCALIILALLLLSSWKHKSKQHGWYRFHYNERKEAIPDQPIHTDEWKTYTNSTAHFSFKYPSDWYVEEKTADNVHLANLRPIGDANKTIRIYVTKDAYFGTDGIKLTKTKIHNNTIDAVTAEELLYGVQHKNFFITFDTGYNFDVKPIFLTIVNTLELK